MPLLCVLFAGIWIVVDNASIHGPEQPEDIISQSTEIPEYKSLSTAVRRSVPAEFPQSEDGGEQETPGQEKAYHEKEESEKVVIEISESWNEDALPDDVPEDIVGIMEDYADLTEEERWALFQESMGEGFLMSPSEKEAYFKESMGLDGEQLSEEETKEAFEREMGEAFFMSPSERESCFRESMGLTARSSSDDPRRAAFNPLVRNLSPMSESERKAYLRKLMGQSGRSCEEEEKASYEESTGENY